MDKNSITRLDFIPFASGLVIKDIPGYSGYRADSEGYIWGRSGLRLKRRYNKRGYPRVTVERNINEPIHKLVCLAFHGPRPHLLQCRHLDGNKLNSRPDNLVWGTEKENQADARKHGVDMVGAKLDETQVREIRRLDTSGMSRVELSEMFGVTKANICHITKRRIWKHLR